MAKGISKRKRGAQRFESVGRTNHMARDLIAITAQGRIKCDGFDEKQSGVRLWSHEDGEEKIIGYVPFDRLERIEEA